MLNTNSTLRGLDNLKGINLQLFADGEETKTTEAEETTEVKTYTQEELDKLLQAESDRRVSSAREKFEKEFKEKLEKEKKETERLSKLSADEKEKALLKKQQEQLAEKEKAIQLRELQLDAINILAEESLPVGFADFLIKDDAETTKGNIDKFKKEWQEALSKAVDEKIKGTSPKLPETKIESNQVSNFMKLADEASIRK